MNQYLPTDRYERGIILVSPNFFLFFFFTLLSFYTITHFPLQLLGLRNAAQSEEDFTDILIISDIQPKVPLIKQQSLLYVTTMYNEIEQYAQKKK